MIVVKTAAAATAAARLGREDDMRKQKWSTIETMDFEWTGLEWNLIEFQFYLNAVVLTGSIDRLFLSFYRFTFNVDAAGNLIVLVREKESF